MQDIELGDVAKDKISGFQGVVIGVTQWLHGCERLVIAPQELKDGKPIDSQSFDRPQLELVSKSEAKRQKPTTGGPAPTPSRGPTVSRR